MFRCFKHHAEGRVTTPEGCPEEEEEEKEEEGLFRRREPPELRLFLSSVFLLFLSPRSQGRGHGVVGETFDVSQRLPGYRMRV
jgi:hypothetical protein